MEVHEQPRYIITGATGNTGSKVIQKLVEGMPATQVIALVRDGSDLTELARLGVRTQVCDLGIPETYVAVVNSGDVFIGVANLRFSDKMLPHLIDAGISHAFIVTTTAVFSTHHSYSALYREIEARIMSQPVPVAVLRPSMIYGNMRDHNMHRLISALRKTPVFPVLGPGTALMQPVFVDDLAEAIVSAVERRVKGPFNLAGPEPLTYNDVLKEVSSALGKSLRLVHIDHRLAALLAKLLERVPKFPVKHEQVMRLLENKAFDISKSQKELSYRPRSFREGIRSEVASMTRTDG